MIDPSFKYYVTAAILIYLLIRWIRSWPVKPDPWDNLSENHEHDDVIDVNAKEIPVCTNCLEPILDPRQHYCPKCGNVTGEYTRYIPFVNIQFQYSIFGKMWSNVKSTEKPLLTKVASLLIVGVIAPAILVIWGIGIIISILMKFCKKKK